MRNISKHIYRSYRVVGEILIISSVTIFITYFYMWLSSPEKTPLGENMVRHEFILIPGVLAAKPITFTVLIAILGYILVMASIKNPIRRSSLETIYIVESIAIFFLFISAYELVFNFMYWSSLINIEYLKSGSIVNIDLLSSKFLYSDYSWNLVFATKFFFMILSICLITIFFTDRWLKKYMLNKFSEK